MECFVKDDARMAVIATVSPNPTDTEHIVSTLRTACMISGSDAGCRELKENVPMTELMRREAQRQVYSFIFPESRENACGASTLSLAEQGHSALCGYSTEAEKEAGKAEREKQIPA